MPLFWQLYSLCLVIASVSIIVISHQSVFHVINLVIQALIMVGLYAALKSHQQQSFPRLLLVSGAGLIVVGMALRSLIYWGLPIDNNVSLGIEELGIALVTIFAYMHILLFEEKFNIKGFAIDLSLLIVASLFFFLVISPDLLNTFVYKISFTQQLLVINILFGSVLLFLSIIHYFLSKTITVTDAIRVLLTSLLVIHFSLEMLISWGGIENALVISRVAWSLYHIAGIVTILFVFIEKLSVNYSPVSPSLLGNQFMWGSSIVAIISIPMGLVVRSLSEAPPLNLLLIGIPSVFVSSLVIWRFIIIIHHSNEQKKRLKRLVQTDALTGLANYQGYLEKVTIAKIKKALVISLNIEDFKAINDLYGRSRGDDILKSLATRLEQLPDIFLAVHLHSDQFLAVFQVEESNVKQQLKMIEESLGIWDNIQGKKIAVPLTYGVSYNKEIANPELLAKEAELALKDAREQHTSLSFYAEETSRELPRHELRHILQKAVDDAHLPVHFQPIYNVGDGSLKALELLIRVDSKKHGLLLPRQFLEQAKSYGLLTSLTQVCIKMVAKYYVDLPDVVININLPPYMLKSPRLLNNFIHLFEKEGLPANRFCLEITEDGDISAQSLIPAIKKLKGHGFLIAMDDFGSGYSSLDRLSILAVDTVKIDRSLLLSASSGNTAILEWAILLAKRLGISAVVEGVETKEQLSMVKLLGADAIQGFLYSKPVPANKAADLILNSNDISIV